MSIELEKQFAHTCLREIELIDPHAIVAGGAPRDWYLGRQCSDIDIFMYSPLNQQSSSKLLKTLERLMGGNWRRMYGEHVAATPDEMTSEYKMNPDVIDVFERQAFDTQPKLQVVRLSSPPYNVIDNFPLSISKVWFKNNTMHHTRDFNLTMKHKAIFKTLDQYADSHPYIRKVVDKFPDFNYYSSELAFLRSVAQL